MFGFYRAGAAVPNLKIGNIPYNLNAILKMAETAEEREISVLVLPELCISAYSCADLFHQSILLEKIPESLAELAEKTKKLSPVILVGAPLKWKNGIYNCGVVIHKGRIKGVIPKTVIPNYREFYEKRWFNSGKNIKSQKIELNGEIVPFGINLLFSDGVQLIFAVEICADLWSSIPPSTHHCIAGANMVFNLSASNDIIGKADYRRDLVRQQSARCFCAYIYCSSGISESTTDLVFGGHSMISENGVILEENKRFDNSETLIFADIDCQKLSYSRFSESGFKDDETFEYDTIMLSELKSPKKVERFYDPKPFVPSDKIKRDERCEEIFNIQSVGLARRVRHTNSQKLVLGISGGLDSSLALNVAKNAFKMLGKKSSDIIAVTMPGFGTGKRTLKNASELARLLGTDFRKIDITKICENHLKDIGQNQLEHNLVFENAQARERTQILMDIANAENGIVVGTGDLSEIALGWSTFNGDHISMYAVNCGVPKTLIRYIVAWIADNSPTPLRNVLLDILDTPVSPELLPSGKNNNISQKTEEILGPYELHDFFLYHCIKYGASPSKLSLIAKIAFAGTYSGKEIQRTLKIFISRFFANQFKRNCMPDGPKVGTIALSPRGDWRMVSDADPELWIEDIQ
jgi:NAD+ synthase (glutamine-hydrolysing)